MFAPVDCVLIIPLVAVEVIDGSIGGSMEITAQHESGHEDH